MTCCVGYKAFGRDAGWASNCRVCTCGEGAGRQGCGLLDGRVCIERGGLKGWSGFLVGLACLRGSERRVVVLGAQGGLLIAGFAHMGGYLSPVLWASGRQGLH